jgi:hypothetical protein
MHESLRLRLADAALLYSSPVIVIFESNSTMSPPNCDFNIKSYRRGQGVKPSAR